MFAASRLFRAGMIFGIGWLVLEWVLMSLIAARIGWGMLVILLSLKGGLGLIATGMLAQRGLATLIRGLRTGQAPAQKTGQIAQSAFQVASAILVALPGIVPLFVAMALFSPSIRQGLLQRFFARNSAGQETGSVREFSLEAGEWAEVVEVEGAAGQEATGHGTAGKGIASAKRRRTKAAPPHTPRKEDT